MENMFKEAYFGKKYLTRNGKLALYLEPLHGRHILAPQGYDGAIIAYRDNGEVVEGEEQDYDIVKEAICEHEEVIEKACAWFSEHIIDYVCYSEMDGWDIYHDEMHKDFRKAMACKE